MDRPTRDARSAVNGCIKQDYAVLFVIGVEEKHEMRDG